MTAESAVRITRVLTGIFTCYLVLMTSALVALRYLPRSVSPIGPAQHGLIIEAMLVHGGALLLVGLGLLLAMRAKRASIWVPRILSVVYIVCGVAVADQFVGVFFPPREVTNGAFVLHEARGWTNRPHNRAPIGKTPMYFDALGMRVDAAGETEVAHDAVSILFVGDSVTLGFKCSAREVYCRQTVELLQRRHRGVKIAALNGGTCGYDTRQECHWLTDVGLTLDPDLIVLQFCLNDVTRQFDPAFGQDFRRHEEFLWVARRDSRSGIRRAITELRMRMRFGHDLQAVAEQIEHFALHDILKDQPDEHVEKSWRIVLNQLEFFVQRCREADVPMVLICFPVKEQIRDVAASRNPQDRLRRFAESQSIPFFDLLPAFHAAYGTGPDAADASFVDSTHPTITGNKVAGEALARFIEESDLLSMISGPPERPG